MSTILDPMSLAQFGFAVIACYMLWVFIKDLIPQLLVIVKQNTEALTETSSALRELIGGQRDQSVRLGRMDDRLLVLEEQHKYGVRECPLMDGRPNGRRKTDRLIIRNDGKEPVT